MNRNLCFRALAYVFVTIPALVVMAVPAYGAADAPPGNNGTIKIDDVPMDEGNENNPHPGCTFVIDFFGYDVGTRTATIELEGHAPTGGGMLLSETFTFDVASRESGNELNHSHPVDLSDELAGIEPHPKQGWHVKLTVHVDGAQGSDVKHKVFWISECDVAPMTTADDVEAEAESVPVPEVEAPTATPVAVAPVAQVADSSAAAPAPAQPEAQVLSASETAPAGAGAGATSGATAGAAAPAGQLPRTGPGTSWALVAVALLALGAGSTALGISRRLA